MKEFPEIPSVTKQYSDESYPGRVEYQPEYMQFAYYCQSELSLLTADKTKLSGVDRQHATDLMKAFGSLYNAIAEDYSSRKLNQEERQLYDLMNQINFKIIDASGNRSRG